MMGGMMGGPLQARARFDNTITRQQVKRGTIRRILPYARPYRWLLISLVLISCIDSGISVAGPLLLRAIIDDGILLHRISVIVILSLASLGLALVDAAAMYGEVWSSARVGQGLIYDLRAKVFRHVQQQPLAFFTRAQTGSLVSRLNTDVIGAQQAVTSLLSQTVSTFLTLILVILAMFYLSWQMAVGALVVIPFFIFPGKLVGKRLQRLSREGMQLDAELGSMMNERFNVGGAMLTKLYGRPDEESRLFDTKAARVRDIAIVTAVYGRVFFILISVLTAVITAGVYGFGGVLVVHGVFQIGTLVAMVALITRLYGPINQMSNMQINFLTALVSFDRVFEVLDLKPLIAERAGASRVSVAGSGNGAAPAVDFDHVSFRYPNAREVSLASLESIALPAPERADNALILNDVSFCAPSGQVTALVGPTGAGKTTITYLVPRLYDPASGTVRIGGRDIRDLTLQSLRETVGVVSQDTYLFHDTIRANLQYADPCATEQDLIEACKAARIWDMISSLPNALDTVVGDRGYRLSGGEKQRVAVARLLLKGPSVVVLDEATAHLDSESEAAIQHALRTALAGRTSVVIAHRLSTIRDAAQILVIDAGRVCERGTHEELQAASGLYAELYRIQFAPQASNGGKSAAASGREPASGERRMHPPGGLPLPPGFVPPPGFPPV